MKKGKAAFFATLQLEQSLETIDNFCTSSGKGKDCKQFSAILVPVSLYIAQLVEHWTDNAWVSGLIPALVGIGSHVGWLTY